MKIEIDVPDSTQAISVSALYRIGGTDTVSLTSRCFAVIDGKAYDETGSNKVLSGGADNA